jgi:ABC-2 type transport system ATP-binding protein
MFKGLSVVAEGDKLLTDVSLDLPVGHVIGLLGPSGAGKTTLMRVLVGLRKISKGSAKVFGLPAGHRKLRPQVGYATQSLSVYTDLTVKENLAYFAAMVNAPGSQVHEVMEEVSLVDHAGHLVRRLSGGQRARVSLAVALLGRPKLLVLDEPTVGLDPLLRKQLWDHFHRLAAEGVTLLVSSHVMDEAERCDELVLIREGRVVGYGTPAAIKQQTGATGVEEAFIKLIGGKA